MAYDAGINGERREGLQLERGKNPPRMDLGSQKENTAKE